VSSVAHLDTASSSVLTLTARCLIMDLLNTSCSSPYALEMAGRIVDFQSPRQMPADALSTLSSPLAAMTKMELVL
jgi:hypothetical protein